jgi:hypothetical protein
MLHVTSNALRQQVVNNEGMFAFIIIPTVTHTQSHPYSQNTECTVKPAKRGHLGDLVKLSCRQVSPLQREGLTKPDTLGG